MLNARLAGFGGNSLTEVVLFLGGTQRGVAVRRAHHSKFVRVSAELLFQLHAVLERFASVLTRKHVVRLEHR